MKTNARQRLHAIVLAGGRGERMRETVRGYEGRDLPKQYCTFGLERTLLQETVTRMTRLISPELVMVVVDEAWADEAAAQLRGFVGIEILAQPADRGTGAGLLWPLVRVAEMDPSAMVLVTPADHGIRDESSYWRGILAAHSAIDDAGAEIVLLGSPADAPRTDYGWIVPGPCSESRWRRVVEFVEKPPPDIALRLFRTGAFWNTMVLVARATALRALFLSVMPGEVTALERACAADAADPMEQLRGAYREIARTDFSHDVLTRARNLLVIRWPQHVGWSDLGTPERMAEFLRGTSGSGAELQPADCVRRVRSSPRGTDRGLLPPGLCDAQPHNSAGRPRFFDPRPT